MSSRSWNASLLCALAASSPAVAGVTRGVGAPAVVAIANAYAISTPVPPAGGPAAPYARGHRFFALPLRVAGQTFASIPGEFGEYAPAITARLATWSIGGSDLACTASPLPHPGAIVVIDRGSCSFSTKIRNARAAGAAGVVIVDNDPRGPTVMAQDGTANQPKLPAVMVSQADGAALKARAGLTATIDGSLPSTFSAPALAAAGADLHNPMNVGFGVLAVAAARSPIAALDPATVSFRKPEPVPREISVTVTNPTEATHTYEASIAIVGLSSADPAAASVSVSPASLTLAPGESAELSLTVDAAEIAAAGPWWGRLTVTPEAGSALAAPFWFAVRSYTDAGPLQ